MINLVSRQLILIILGIFALTILTFGLSRFFPELTIYHGFTAPDSTSILGDYFYYLSQIFTGQWGDSLISGQSVLKEFLVYFPATFELIIVTLLFSLAVGLPLGIYAAENKNKWPDKLIISTTLIGYSLPMFWWGMLLILFFSLSLGLTPVASRLGFEYDILPVTGFMLIDTLLSDQPYALEAFQNAVYHLVLPTVVLGTIPIAIFARVTRSAMIDALSSDYIRSAKSKGIPHNQIVWSHALRNAMIPIVTIIGLQLNVLLTGTLITEKIFAWPGIGKWLLEAVYRRDIVTIHGGLLAIATIVIVTNALVEILNHLLNPRARFKQ